MDRAQELFWKIQALERLGALRRTHPLAVEAARVHEQQANELLGADNPDGWVDLWTAVTYWGRAGHYFDADRLLNDADERAQFLSSGKDNVIAETRRLRDWLANLTVVPALSDLAAAPLPEIPRMAAA